MPEGHPTYPAEETTIDERPSRVSIDFDVPARMRDGVTLRANVYRPEGNGPWPTLLTRLPYGKDITLEMTWLDPVQTARKGFMVVVQDARGRFASDGDWVPFQFDREDGYDSVEWAARLRGSNGRVGMYGTSYLGNTQWLAAIEQPPSLRALAPALTWCDPLDGLLGRGGALELGIAVPWTLTTGAAHLARLGLSDEQRAARSASLQDDFDDLLDHGYWGLPVHDLPALQRHGLPDIGTLRMLREPGVPALSRVAGAHDQVTVPTLHIGAWHDIFLQGTLDNYMAMAALGRPTKLVVGPWVHDLTQLWDPIGELSFGIRSGAFGTPIDADGDLAELQLAWLGQHLATNQPAAADRDASAVRLFVMGRNEWRSESAWPLERAHTERWFLRAGATLAPDAPGADEQPSRFVYDPSDPVPTLGGQSASIPGRPPGPFDQARVESRHDVLTFTSAPLHQDFEVTGRVRAVLHVESSAPSTDWVARLCDVHPDGRSFNVCDGILRIDERSSSPQCVEIDLWSTSNVFLRGHRLRLQVTSSCFPRWDRNLNTGDQRRAEHRPAHQRIQHRTDLPSFVKLPVID